MSWWNSLSQREQLMFGSGAVVLLIGLLYWAVWQPQQEHIANTERSIQAQQQTLRWLDEKAQEVVNLRALGRQSQLVESDINLSQLINQTVQRNQIKLTRIQPSNDQIQVWADEVEFNRLLSWLEDLQKSYGVQVISLELTALPKPGAVKVQRLTLGASS